MSTAVLALRSRAERGPALRRARLPVASIALSAVIHAAVIGGGFVLAAAWRAHQPKMYIVNLVPAVAAVGAPQPQPEPTPAPAPKVVEPTPPPKPEATAPKPPPPTPLPERTPTPDLPTRSVPREMPQRSDPPARTASSGLPDPALPTRAPALPRPDLRDLPPVASATPPRPVPVPAQPTPTVAAAPPRPTVAPPPPPVGRPTGSPVGTGPLTLSAGDFPFTWYLMVIEKKISEKWAPPASAAAGHIAVVVFEIGRDGRVQASRIEKSSGDPLYDLAARRAIEEANPFPQLPPEFTQQFLRVHLGFNYTGDRR